MLKTDEVERPVKDAELEEKAAINLYQHGEYHGAARLYEHLLHVSEGKIHPLYGPAFSSLMPLFNCQRHLGQLKEAAGTMRRLIDAINMDTAIAEHHIEKADFYVSLGETLAELLENGYLNKTVAGHYRKEAREAFEKAVEIRSVCYGPDHRATRHAAQLAKGLLG